MLFAAAGAGSIITAPAEASPSQPDRANTWAIPSTFASEGASSSEAAKARAMPIPYTIIARARREGAVMSAIQAAVTAAAAPPPCKSRPAASCQTVSAAAATNPPSEKISSMQIRVGFRPQRSEIPPAGICKSACVMP